MTKTRQEVSDEDVEALEFARACVMDAKNAYVRGIGPVMTPQRRSAEIQRYQTSLDVLDRIIREHHSKAKKAKTLRAVGRR